MLKAISPKVTKRLGNRSKRRIYYVHVIERFLSQLLKQCHKVNKISKTKQTVDNIKILNNNIKTKLLISKKLNNKYLVLKPHFRTKYLLFNFLILLP